MDKERVGPFEIIRRLGSRRDKVYHARQVEQNRDVALKFILIPPTVPMDQAIQRIETEVGQLRKLRHQNLIHIYGAGFEDQRIFFAMEFLAGETLAAVLSRRSRLAPDQVVEFGRQICEALQFLHERGLVHSQLTPEKIMVLPDQQIKVTDFRLNRANSRRWDQVPSRDIEQAAYMAPEQFSEGATDKSDFYSLGVILYEMLSGKLPYPPDTKGRMQKNKINAPVPSVATHVMNCPIWLDQIVTQMLDPDPRKRPHTAKAIKMAFDEIKKIDASKTAAVSQMTSGFNALTAGQDKTEARRLLSNQKRRRRRSGNPIHQSVWFQVLCLLALSALIVFLLWPLSDQKIIAAARRMIESNQAAKWSEARDKLLPIMNSNRELATEAEILYYQSRRKTLVRRAKRGNMSAADSDAERLFFEAISFEQNGDDLQAAEIHRQLAQTVSPTDDQRHVYQEAAQRLPIVLARTQWPNAPDELLTKIAATEKWTATPQLIKLQKILGDITIKHAGDPDFQAVISAANQRLEQIEQQLATSDTQ